MIAHYVSTALRQFRRHRFTTAINVACLTIGLVCFLAIYAVVAYLGNGDQHYANADRIYMINESSNGSITASAAAWNTAKYLKVEFPELEAVARATFTGVLPSEVPVNAGDRKTFAHVMYADPEFLDVFALPFLAGDSRNALRAPASAVISADTAVRLFGGVEQSIGRSVRLQGLQLTGNTAITVRGVVGTLRQPSHIRTTGDGGVGLVRFDVLVSMDVLESRVNADPTVRGIMASGAWSAPLFLTYVVLPRDGSLTAATLHRRMEAFGPRYANPSGGNFRFKAVPVGDYWLAGLGSLAGADRTGIDVTAIFYFLGVVVLLTSCLNYANLSTAQGTTRAKEIGMRRVVGASRGQIIAQFMFEAALLSLAALACALIVVTATMATLNVSGLTFVVTAVIATGGFWLTLLALLATVTVAAGAYPAFVLSGVRPVRAAQAAKVRSGGRFVPRLLVGLQFATASFLLVSMLVMTAQNRESKRAVLSGSEATLVSISNNIAAAGIDYEVLRTELLRQPHIEAVTGSLMAPGAMMGNTQISASAPDAAARRVAVNSNDVNQDFFATLGIELLAGRVFDRSHDDVSIARERASNVIIDRTYAERLGWSDPAAAVGRTLYLVSMSDDRRAPVPRTVIGVVADRTMTLISPFGAVGNIYALSPRLATLPVIRIKAHDMSAAIAEIEAVWGELAPTVALKVEFTDQVVARAYRYFDVIAGVFTGVAALALAISVLGLIGMSTHVIGRRRHEIGVRKTLGASVQAVLRLLLVDFSKPVVLANLLAWPLAYLVMSFYLQIFTQRTSLSFAPFLASLVITLGIAWIAVSAQTLRAARVKPAEVLRYE